MTTNQNKEAGFVSLFTVLFFILFITVITLGFLRIMGIEQQQSLNNDLTASALAAADSGIEDGKRAILAYTTTTNPGLRTALTTAFTSNQCDSLTGSAVIRGALGIDAGGNVIGNPSLNQYYTCLTVNMNSPDYINNESAGTSDYIPLVPAGGNFNRIKISWHLISPTLGPAGDGIPANYAPGPLLPPVVNVVGNPANSWSTQGYPAYLRVQVYGYPKAKPITRTALDSLSRTLLLVPTSQSNAAGVGATTPINIDSSDPRGYEQPKTNLQQIKCVNNPAGNVGGYACTALLEVATLAPSAITNYYLRVTPMYGQSHFQVNLLNGNSPVDLSGVQPIVDATGRAQDIFRREQARVRINPVGSLPEFVVESVNTICKNMVVSDDSFYQANSCP
jgi:Tfp pilus assembly protein PilX